MAFLMVDFGIANFHDFSIALVKVSKNMLKPGCSKLYEQMRLDYHSLFEEAQVTYQRSCNAVYV